MPVAESLDRAQLDAFLAERGFAVDHVYDPHHTRNKFRDLYVGTGKSIAELIGLQAELREAISNRVTIDQVDNPDHSQYGQRFIIIHSYWNE